ncbi:MAG: hypothetical protein ACRD3G_11110 [Vicinamibacterales bacterium]
MCCDFRTVAPDTAPLDPHKRVRHFAGLVLGPEEFQQDQLYFMERARLHQRAAHGYGTMLGLGVRVRDNASGRPEVLVDPGLAAVPRGELVCVRQAQCADLDAWLTAHQSELSGGGGATGSPAFSPPVGSPPSSVTLWVVLCWRECATDLVPVLGDPCRTAEDATAASRFADDFELKLVTTRPEHVEEAAVRLFAALLRLIDVTDVGGPFLSPQDIAAMVRKIVPVGSPAVLPSLGDLVATGSPPVVSSPPFGPLLVHPLDAPAVFLAAWREWISFVRPQLAAGAAGCAGGGEPCVLLARLDLGIIAGGAGLQVDGPVTVDDVDRPWLLHTRALQELSLTAWMGADLI